MSLPPSYGSFFPCTWVRHLSDKSRGGGGEQETVDGEVEENGKCDPSLDFSSSCEMALDGVPLDQSRPRAFLQMIDNFTFNMKTTVVASRSAGNQSKNKPDSSAMIDFEGLRNN